MTTTTAAERPVEAADSFAALSAAVHPAWHQAILRLAGATERVSAAMALWMATPGGDDFVTAARDLAKNLIDFLDEIEGDPDADLDFEEVPPDADALDLVRCGLMYDNTDEDPTEEDDHAEDDGTAEPSLGSLERHPTLYVNGRDRVGDQTDWAAGNRTDLEDEHDGGEPDEDGEPSLGWTEAATGDEVRGCVVNDYEGGDDYEGRVAYLDQRRAKSPLHNRPGFMRGPDDAA